MKINRILLMIGIVAIAFIFVMNVSFAASSEKLEAYKGSFYSNTEKKVSNVEQVFAFNYNNSKEYYKISIKKNYQNKYKIKSVNATYSVFDNKTYKAKYFYKNYNGKNKNFLKIKSLNNDTVNLEKLVINYYTKGKIKHESFKPYYISNFIETTYLSAKKANAKLVQKLNFKIRKHTNFPKIEYQNIKIITKNKKYKIKAVKFGLVDVKDNKMSYKTFKGYGKNSFKTKLYTNQVIAAIKVYYY
ncbi:hypothetical protein KQY27_06130 [Methanobrevibacter sp. TMH8]|uniref:hypothetical protein n=1 Tax=Methanobrevibacter sp. TMH8 TaxID=2848611 RepID=UPI001CCE1EB9|nr:hypothetical protein [Methanobrevibacter sp. TMH8]MBZ9571115.1 hypothetical protein [Methanobrevibacter sp. TMH8]